MKFVANDIGREILATLTTGMRKPIAAAAAAAMRDVADLAVREGRAEIAAAGFKDGYFPWQKGLKAQVFPASAPSLKPAIRIEHKVYIISVFEHGTEVKPLRRQLMWLPLRRNLPAGWPRGGNRGGPRAFRGELRSVNRPGRAPLLVGRPPGSDKDVPLFVGIPAAKMPKLFNLYQTFKRASDQFAEFYSKHLKT